MARDVPKPDSRSFAASEVRWQDSALCNGEPLETFVPDKETEEGLATARQTCDLCSVRVNCVRYALTYGLRGYWGGTDTAERKRLRAKKDRAKCPSCTSRNVIRLEGTPEALCLACGMSWQTADAATPRKLQRAPQAEAA